MWNGTAALSDEYVSVVESMRPDASDATLSRALVEQCEWTPKGAATVVHLARTYGTFVLRNALVFASALGIEDGSAGL